MRRRRLTPEERALWDQVARSAEPLPQRPRISSSPAPRPVAVPATIPKPVPTPLVSQPPVPEFRVGERADPVRNRNGISAPALASHTPQRPLRMDARTHGRMRKGRLTPEARIDLHGMTLAQAHGALVGFILASRAAGRRLVLVITGKGRSRGDGGALPMERGLLRTQVPDWLTLPPLVDLVLDVTPAHASHGGGGALYVYLRKR